MAERETNENPRQKFSSLNQLDETWITCAPPERQYALAPSRWNLRDDRDIEPNLKMRMQFVRDMQNMLPHADNITIHHNGLGGRTSASVHNDDWLVRRVSSQDSAAGELAELLAALDLPSERLLMVINFIEDPGIMLNGPFGKFQMLANVSKKRIITLDKGLSNDGFSFPLEACNEYFPENTTRIKRVPSVTFENGFTVTGPTDDTIEEIDL